MVDTDLMAACACKSEARGHFDAKPVLTGNTPCTSIFASMAVQIVNGDASGAAND
jgi:hypothetical protein